MLIKVRMRSNYLGKKRNLRTGQDRPPKSRAPSGVVMGQNMQVEVAFRAGAYSPL